MATADIFDAEAYNNLISEVNKEVGMKNVNEYVKRNYANVIESRRALYAVKTIGQLVNVLEQRDEINENDVSVLKNILKYFYDSENCDEAVKKMYELIILYSKLHSKSNNQDGLCMGCSAPTQVKNLVWNNVSPVETRPKPVDKESNSLDDVQIATREIEDELSGNSWAKLGRHLGVKESHIVNLKMQVNTKEISEIVHEMFQLWIKQKGEEATVEVLINALNHQYVARRDLSSKLKKLFKHQ